MKFGRISQGPPFRRVTGRVKEPEPFRLNDREIARLVTRAAQTGGLRGDQPEKDPPALFSGHSFRTGLAASAEVDERHVQKQLGHASAETTRRYQRGRDRFRVTLTKAAGLQTKPVRHDRSPPFSLGKQDSAQARSRCQTTYPQKPPGAGSCFAAS